MVTEARNLDLCDKCGERVPNDNCAVELEKLVDGKSFLLIFAQRRHLLPTEKCEGSPSRAQYLEGQKRDPRGTYPYRERLEQPLRAAHRLLQQREG